MTIQTSETVTGRPPFDPVDISTLDFWAQSFDEREKAFKILRDERPVSWHRPPEGSMMEPEIDGVWVVTRHEDVAYVSKNPEVFQSGQGITFEAIPEEMLDATQSFLGMDGAKHSSLRRLVSSVFTPRQVAKIKNQVEAEAKSIVDDLLLTKEGDFIQQVASRLPMWTLYEMLGLPKDEREEAARYAEGMVAWADPEVAAGREPGEVLTESLVGLLGIGMSLAERRREKPESDIWTKLVQAEVDGRQLTDDELGPFFVLLSVAGNDTTRTTTAFTTLALQQFPQQRALLEADFDGRIGVAIEEFVRWTTPVMTFRRTATQDTELRGQHIRKGDWVTMVYSSANRDERAIVDPYDFDVTRSPNPHLGFGGGGPHFCMGAFMGKMQLESIFRELIFRAPNLRVGEPEYLTGNFITAVKSLPYTLD
jgi:cytochrome P450